MIFRALGNAPLTAVHLGLFSFSLALFCSEEQLTKWLPLVLDLKIIGAFAQTELGHGKFCLLIFQADYKKNTFNLID